MKRSLATLAAVLTGVLTPISVALAQDCARDAMLVFDGSASMAELGLQRDGPKRIDHARLALSDAMPQIAPIRRIGLLTYGPGPENSCEGINLKFAPIADAAGPVLKAIELLDPNGLTPLTEAVREAAEVLNYRSDPGIVVLVTDGNDTCDGRPCSLGAELATTAKDLTVHVVGFRVVADKFKRDDPAADIYPDGVSYAKCISDQTGGLYISTQTIDELSEALRRTLGCAFIG